jgi:hypothetical protein
VERVYFIPLKNVIPACCYKNYYGFAIGFAYDPRKLHTGHAVHDYIEQYEVVPFMIIRKSRQ